MWGINKTRRIFGPRYTTLGDAVAILCALKIRARSKATRPRRSSILQILGRRRLLRGFCHVGHRKEAQQDQRLVTGVPRDMFSPAGINMVSPASNGNSPLSA